MKIILKKIITMNYKIIPAISITFLLFCQLSAQNNSEIRTFIKTVPVNNETILEVTNKYGTIEITQWKKDSAYIRSEIKAVAPNKDKLSKMFEGIAVNITEANYLIRAETDFTNNINMFFENFKGMTSKLISYDSRVEINYYISIPEYLNLKIENKYGNVYMEDNSGDFSIIMSNGSFKANSIGKGSNIKIAFCDASIKAISSGIIDASFSEISIADAGVLSLNSISSKYEIQNAGAVTMQSRRDKFNIDEISTIKGTSYFTDFNIGNLRKEIDISTRYGNMNFDLINRGFESININSGYSDIWLDFDIGSSYNLDVRHANASLVISDNNSKTEMRVLNEDKKEYVTFGTVGHNPGTSKVKIDASRGNIHIK
jgi:hypothetical protein